jgi:hypothetical protein
MINYQAKFFRKHNPPFFWSFTVYLKTKLGPVELLSSFGRFGTLEQAMKEALKVEREFQLRRVIKLEDVASWKYARMRKRKVSEDLFIKATCYA